jgi:hypothetical protein
VAQRHRGTVVPIYARPHLQRPPKPFTKRQAAETPAQVAMVVESPRHGGELDLAEMNGDEGDERRRGRRFPTVRRKRAWRRFVCPTQQRWRLPELVRIARRHHRRRAVARAREGIRVRVSSGRLSPTGLGWSDQWAQVK